MAARTWTWLPATESFSATSLSRRHSLRLTRMTLTRSWSPTTTHEARNASPLVISGVSVSTMAAPTFTRVTNASGQSPFANTFGDPVVLYNKPTQTWFTVWLDGNAGCTLGGFKSTDPSDPNSWTHFCVHPSGGDDRESGWADNNPSLSLLREHVYFLERL